MTPRFTRFVAIDWSGAARERHPGIAVAVCEADGPPKLAEAPKGGWSRGDILHLLRGELAGDTLVGLDLGISLPFADCGAYFPSAEPGPTDARRLWALVDEVCADDPHLAASSFVDGADFAPYFRRHAGREGARFRCDGATHGRGRFRVTERAQERMGCKPYSNFNLVGAAQVGKASLTGMRVLHRLAGRVPVWPIDPVPPRGPVIVEIYTAIAAVAAGRPAARAKMRSHQDLNQALAGIASPPVESGGLLDDHRADALLAAAWLRSVADDARLWHPEGLTQAIARTEGWTFGAF